MSKAIDDIRRALDCDAAVAIDKERVRILFRLYDGLMQDVMGLAKPLAEETRSTENKLDLVDHVVRRAREREDSYPRDTLSSSEATLARRVQDAYDALDTAVATGRPGDGILAARACLRFSGLLERK